jgi:uncharacterized protein
MTGRAVHFTIPVDHPERASAFYRAVMGWSLERMGPLDYWTISGGSGTGIDGGVTLRSADDPRVVVYINVTDIDSVLTTVESNGGQAVTGRLPIPGRGWIARFVDSEGNLIGLFQEDSSTVVVEPGR